MKKIISTFFLFTIYFFSFFTLKSQCTNIDVLIKNTSKANNNIKDFSKKIEEILKDGFFHKNDVINFYGLSERFLGRRLSSDGNYYRDTSNLMHYDFPVYNIEKFYNDNDSLSNYCRKNNIPYLVLQVPERATFGDDLSKYFYPDYTTNYVPIFKEKVLKNNDLYLDVERVLKEKKLKPTEIFFKSDGHMQTTTELIEVQEIVKILMNKGIKFYKSEEILDFENPNLYEKEYRRFLGNFGYQYGKLYLGTDKFYYYIPKFETNIFRINKDGFPLTDSNNFRISMLNGAFNNKKNWQYFIIDFLNFPEPYVEIDNNFAVNGPNILVFIDSMSMRAVTYLSLMCKKIIVLDPRQFNEENNYFKKIKKNNFDAVITFVGHSMLNTGLTYE